MIFVSLNYLETLEDGRQKVAGAYFGAASTLEGIAEVLKEAMRPGLTISDVRLFGQAEKVSVYSKLKSWFQGKINQRKETDMRMRKIRIKQVPDAEPNADGVWVEREVDLVDLEGEYRTGHTLWDNLNKLCDAGHHAVKYEVLS